MKPIRQIFLLCIFIFSFNVQAQKEFSNWYFGNKAGVRFLPTFNTDLNSAMIAEEGCATISDLTGNLLFYSNGEIVWNKKHQIMNNGTNLNGNASATQSVSIIPNPGKANQYLIFTLDALNGAKGLQYSIVDMTYNSGEGKVISKNNTLQTGITEKMAITKDKSGDGYWLLTLECSSTSNTYSSKFYSYHITSSGVSNPIISTIYTSSFNCAWVQGQMKISPDGKYIALTGNVNSNDISVFTFNNENGNIADYQTINTSLKYYGIEFSANSKILYATVTSQNKLHQFIIGDKMSKNFYEINCNNVLWGMQLGLDGKIYIAKSGGFLAVINSPNTAGNFSGFNEYGFSLAGRNAIQGMPSIPSNLLKDEIISFTHNCQDSGIVFDLAHSSLDSMIWDFGDFSSVYSNNSKEKNPIHNYKKTGIYNVTVKIWRNGVFDIISREIDIKTGPVFDLGKEKFLCKDVDLKLKININNGKYSWNTGENTQEISVSETGTYFATADIGGCIFRDTVKILADSLIADFNINLNNLCLKTNEISVKSNIKNAKKTTWYIDNKIEPEETKLSKINFYKPGIHFIKLEAESVNACKISLKKDLVIHPNPEASIQITSINACLNENSFTIQDKTPSQIGYTLFNYFVIDSLNISQSSFDYSFLNLGTNKIKLFVVNSAGCKDSSENLVTILANPTADFSIDFSKICLNDQDYFIQNKNNKTTEKYTWKFSDTSLLFADDNASIIAKKAGIYQLTLHTIADNFCKDSITKNLEINAIPQTDFITDKNRFDCLGTGIISFTDNSKTDSTPSLSQWNIEGQEMSGMDISYQFNQNKIYQISHTIVANSCTASIQKDISTFDLPNIYYSINNPEQCKNNNEFILDYAQTIANTPDVNQIYWINEMNEIITQNPYRFSYKKTGNHQVKLYAKTQQGCSDSSFINLNVKDIPTINLSVNNSQQCLGDNLFIANLSDIKEIHKIAWKINDKIVLKNIGEFNYHFSGDGIYSLNTEIEFTNQCKQTFTNELTVYPEPVLKFTAQDICVENETKIYNQSFTGNASISSWKWEIGQYKSNGINPEVIINQVGRYPVKIISTTDENCVTSLQIPNAFIVNEKPYFDFDYKITDWNENKTEVQFYLKSDSVLNNINWNFGNGIFSQLKNPITDFTTSGNFDITLTASNNIGCSNIITKNYFISPPLDIHIPNCFTPNHDRLNETFGPEGNAKCIKYHLIILNRWGVHVFESFDWKDRWNGTFADVILPSDVYQYFIEITDDYGKNYQFNGAVNLVR